ncbi:hypothetical protein CPB83DRAFT_844426 [Crepidotus variabilis]|uniref:Needs CLA4 to survive protein 3 n=1 Tax=Crepidotus variabilis TaxID=179855 RepID=A0A9P6JV89_9AGAR|nr:hypothetical protein CPB83DRAFT_844426 [Crepidotus variabilis]
MSALPLLDYQRYGRQMILDGIGFPGQVKLRKASVAVVGAGGLGCPALQYLCAAGIGRIGIIDHDRVELSNLQRQILHTEETIGLHKAESAARALKSMNSDVLLDVQTVAVVADNARELLAPYDILLDCTDNVPTRYLLSDTAVALGKPLVSGAAQKFEGQLSVFNYGANGPCYRCLYPTPPPRETVGSCAELGIFGVVTGTIGNLQALETIKIILGLHDETPALLIFSALGTPPFRSIKLRSKKESCLACGKSPRIPSSTDYVQFCGGPAPDWVSLGQSSGKANQRAKVEELRQAIESGVELSIIDVRPPTEFGICQLPGSRNIPLKALLEDPKKCIDSGTEPVYVVCRLGNDSQIAAKALRSQIEGEITVKDVIGGLQAWSKEIDPSFPIY